MGGAQLRARVGPAGLAAQPLPVQQVRPGQLGTKGRAAQSFDRLTIRGLGVSPSLSSARDRAWIPCAQSVWPTLVAAASRSSASAASWVCPVLLAASISSGSAHAEIYSSGACSLACRASSWAFS